MLNNDNNLLLIILVGIILFVILNINFKSNKEHYVSSNSVKTDLSKESDKKQSYTPKTVDKIQNNIQNNKVKNIDGNYDNYMLLDSSLPIDSKFDKVMPKETRKTLSSNDLLPKEENDKWFQVPNSKFNLMEAINLEVPELKIGIDTVGQSRKNATYDLRTCPPCPKFVVSPWSNSTIEPDYNTKPLC